jgi:hypothetical protein
MHTEFWSDNMKGSDHLGDRRGWEDDITMHLKEM